MEGHLFTCKLHFAGKVVLDELNIKTEVYYASEIDGDSLLVSKVRHSEGVVQWIGDVTSISYEQVINECIWHE